LKKKGAEVQQNESRESKNQNGETERKTKGTRGGKTPGFGEGASLKRERKRERRGYVKREKETMTSRRIPRACGAKKTPTSVDQVLEWKRR